MSGHNHKDGAVVTYKYNIDVESVTERRVDRHRVVKKKERSQLSYTSTMQVNIVYANNQKKVSSVMNLVVDCYVFSN